MSQNAALNLLFNVNNFSLSDSVKKDNIVTISSIEGGYICKDCYTNEVIYDSKVIQMLKMYYLVDIKTIKELKI